MSQKQDPSSMMGGIIDFSKVVQKKSKLKFRNENFLSLIHPCNVICCGYSGSGKSTFLCNLLVNHDVKMTYDRVILVCPSLDEELYDWLNEYYNNIQSQVERATKTRLGYQIFTHIADPTKIPELSEFERDKTKLQTLLIFDDMITNKLANEFARKFSIKNRKLNISLIYLSQSYFEIPKLLRQQLGNGYIALWGTPSGIDLRNYMAEFNLGVETDVFKKIFKQATSVKFRPLVIDFKTKDPTWRFRAGLTLALGPPVSDNDSLTESDIESKIVQSL
jgi:hypothetical protein